MNWLIRISQQSPEEPSSPKWYPHPYEQQYKPRVDEAAHGRQTPFKAWFPQGDKIFIPFKGNTQGQFDQDVADVLSDLGCEITDYQGGYCQQGNRTFRIGKAIEMVRRQELKKLEDRFNAGELYDLKREQDAMNKFFDGVMDTFVNSPLRRQKEVTEFYVAISQDPDDVAMMSTGRDWTSCMELGKGSYHESVYCEIKQGALVAYLIRANDSNIEQPLARIHIRRFDNRQGNSVAIPEESIYGNEVPGFMQAVKDWLKQQQGEIAPGFYQRKGGEYSDTFGDAMLIAPENSEEVYKWLRGQGEDAQVSTYTINDNLDNWKDRLGISNYDYDGDEEEDETHEKAKFHTKEEAIDYIDKNSDPYWTETLENYIEQNGSESDQEDFSELLENNTSQLELKETATDHSYTMKTEAMKKILKAPKGTYPDAIIDEVITMLEGRRNDNLWSLVAQKYPEKLNPQKLKEISETSFYKFIEQMPEGPDKEQAKQTELMGVYSWLEDTSFEAWAKNDPKMQEDVQNLSMAEDTNLRDSISLHWAMMFDDKVLGPLQLFKPIPEEMTQKLINFANNELPNLGLMEGRSKITTKKYQYESQTLSRIVHALSTSGTDTPIVQNFYKQLLSRMGDNHKLNDNYNPINIESLGNAIAFLGENGQQFIPWAQKGLEEEKRKLAETEASEETPRYTVKGHAIEVMNKNVERWLYIIDALEKGRPSGKYRFSKQLNWLEKIARVGL